ncbi:MAG TPA: hypothetical protein VHL57_05410, partial [Flavobacteriales bacterium]|nr:hypothetical protein [Flavobacteriales bacterium]
MRDELHLMELVDRYLDGEMDAAGITDFNARMSANGELRLLVDDQRALREGLERLPVRAAIMQAHRSWTWGKWTPGIGGAVLVVGLITAALVLKPDPEHVKERLMRVLPAPLDSMFVDSVLIEVPAPVGADSTGVHTIIRVDTIVSYVCEPITNNEQRSITTEGDFTRADELVQEGRGRTAMRVHEADVAPQYPGGLKALHAFLKENVRYVETGMTNGTVVITLYVDEQGKVRTAYVSKPLDPACDAEAL